MIGYIITALIGAALGYLTACLMGASGRQSDFEEMDKLLDSNAMLKSENERLISEKYILTLTAEDYKQKCSGLLNENARLEQDNAALTENRWIPVKEKLPEVGKCVIVRQTYHPIRGDHGEFEEVSIGYLHQPTDKRHKPYFYWAAVSDYGDMVRAESICPGCEYITHWRPLPEPPEKDGAK